MYTAELIADVRTSAHLNAADDVWTDAQIKIELLNAQHTEFGDTIVSARAGAWCKSHAVTTTAGRTRYRIPYRACAGIGKSIELDTGGSLPYQIEGDQIVFDTAPNAGTVLTWRYYLRPSTLVDTQTAGRVTGVDTAALTVTVNTVPTNKVTAVTVASGDILDVVHPNGWHELAVVNTTATLAGATFTFPTGTDLSDVEIGDYVRAADQTEWPCLPDDYHAVLCLVTGARIKDKSGHKDKAAALRMMATADLARFANVLEPRLKDTREAIVPTVGILRNPTGRRWPTSTV